MFDFDKLFSRSGLLAAPRLILCLDDALTLPARVLYQSLSSPPASLTYESFVKSLAATPGVLLSRNAERLASLQYSDVSNCGIRGTTKEAVEGVLRALAAIGTKSPYFLTTTKGGDVWAHFADKQFFAKAVEHIRGKLPLAELYYLGAKDQTEEEKLRPTAAVSAEETLPREDLRRYSQRELLGVFAAMELRGARPVLGDKAPRAERAVFDTVVRREPILELATTAGYSHDDSDEDENENDHGHDAGYFQRRRCWRRGYRRSYRPRYRQQYN